MEFFFIENLNFIYSIDKTLGVIKIMDFKGLDPDAKVLFFLMQVTANKMELFHTKLYV